ncbi:hypothetical protein HDV64DRAFT_240295 [Trichoderma sp. TUCIM 5745]
MLCIYLHFPLVLYAYSPIRLDKSHHSSIKGPCRAACIQFLISTQANNNNSHQCTSLPWFPLSLHLHAARTAKKLAVGEPTQLSSRSSGYNLAYFRDMTGRAPTCRARPIAIKVTVWSAYNGDKCYPEVVLHACTDMQERRAPSAKQQG